MPELNSQSVSEADIALVDALQLNPRADWAELAAALGNTPKTLARRWAALSERGLAWVAVSPGLGFARHGCAAFLFLDTTPQETHGVVTSLVSDPSVVSVSSTSGGMSLLVDLFAVSIEELTTLVERIETISGVTSVTTALALTTFREGSRWRVQALDLQQAARVTPPQRTAPRGGRRVLDSLDRALIDVLCTDGRQSWTDLAERCETTSQTARRRIERMLDSGSLSLRCEGAYSLVGPLVSTTFLITAPPDEVNRVGDVLGRLEKCRVVEAITGRANILLTMWFRTISEIAPFEAALVRELPRISIAERFVWLRTFKRGGHVLDPEGRSTEVIPLTPIVAGVD